jgi:hypothetical protein
MTSLAASCTIQRYSSFACAAAAEVGTSLAGYISFACVDPPNLAPTSLLSDCPPDAAALQFQSLQRPRRHLPPVPIPSILPINRPKAQTHPSPSSLNHTFSHTKNSSIADPTTVYCPNRRAPSFQRLSLSSTRSERSCLPPPPRAESSFGEACCPTHAPTFVILSRPTFDDDTCPPTFQPINVISIPPFPPRFSNDTPSPTAAT